MSDIPAHPAGLKKKRLTLRTVPDPVLREICSPVANFDKRLRTFSERMLSFMKKNRGIGLAAPQVGVLRRIVVLEIDGKRWCLVNPEIVSNSEDYDTKMEGCLSIPNESYTVPRHCCIEVTAWDTSARKISLEARDLFARVIQHEIDHCNGTLISDTGNRIENAIA
jgi:peptide deformylase